MRFWFRLHRKPKPDGAVQHLSTTGYHRYQRGFALQNLSENTFDSLTDPKNLVKLITDELNSLFKDKNQNKNLFLNQALFVLVIVKDS